MRRVTAATTSPYRVNSRRRWGAVAFGDAEDDDVGAGADRGGVAAEVGAEGEGPPQDVSVRPPGPSLTSRSTTGAMVATYGMLSTIADSTAEPPQHSIIARGIVVAVAGSDAGPARRSRRS